MSVNPSEPTYLKKTIQAIVKLTVTNESNLITVKKIRKIHDIGSSNLSAIQFYSLALKYLNKVGVLEVINNGSPKKYGLKDEEKLKSLIGSREM